MDTSLHTEHPQKFVLLKPFIARFIRLKMQMQSTYQIRRCLRVELLGCPGQGGYTFFCLYLSLGEHLITVSKQLIINDHKYVRLFLSHMFVLGFNVSLTLFQSYCDGIFFYHICSIVINTFSLYLIVVFFISLYWGLTPC